MPRHSPISGIAIDDGAHRQLCSAFPDMPKRELRALIAIHRSSIDEVLDGKSALSCAIEQGMDRHAFDLLDNGASHSQRLADGQTPLHLAAKHGHSAIALHLLGLGADASALDCQGRSPLHLACHSARKGCIEALLDAGANPWALSGSGISPLGMLLLSADPQTRRHLRSDFDRCALRLVDALGGAPPPSPTSRDEALALLIGFAAMHGKAPLLAALAERGANIDAADARGDTPLMKAASRGASAVVAKLIELGADIHATNQVGSDALMFAAIEGHPEPIRLLTAAGCPTDRKTSFGESALSMAIDYLAPAAAAELVKAGADPLAPLRDASDAFAYARQIGEQSTVSALAQAWAQKEARAVSDATRARPARARSQRL